MDSLLTAVTPSWSEVRQKANKPMLFSQHMMPLWLLQDLSRLDLWTRMSLPRSPPFAPITRLSQCKVFSLTRPRSTWLMEMNVLSIRRPQSKESRTGSSPQEMSSISMFTPPLETAWAESLRLEQLCIADNWINNIALRVRVLETSSQSSWRSMPLYHSLLEGSRILLEPRSESRSAWSTSLSAHTQFCLKRQDNSSPNSREPSLFNQNPPPYCAEERPLTRLVSNLTRKLRMPNLLQSLPVTFGKRRKPRRRKNELFYHFND